MYDSALSIGIPAIGYVPVESSRWVSVISRIRAVVSAAAQNVS